MVRVTPEAAPPAGSAGDPSADGPDNSIDQLGYEQARDELADVVRALEVGGLSLDDSLTLWERGERLARRCEQQLAGARDRVDAVLHADASDTNGGGPER
ncbi:MAG: exodeoxyribonuclease small subunit [Pseudonocardiales bacterium]|jgi:exodeoxyribonuclease VII small subunit|nr:exodeoxyribonuclease small subunit [Pseudonocardiales bacterium]MDT7667572.1 exodeoxyribonuclease small subunit [Pseudonocardiales bacterium]MDT7751917.1 exodeoxyribonuclease small subunit [Pseudonocardiales bacterium]